MIVVARNGVVTEYQSLRLTDVCLGDCAFAVGSRPDGITIVVGDVVTATGLRGLTEALGRLPRSVCRIVSARYVPRSSRMKFETVDASDALRRLAAEGRPRHLYHATLGASLPAIAAEGLRHDLPRSRPWDDPDLDDWSSGKVFLSSIPENALAYADHKGAGTMEGGPSVLLHVPSAALGAIEYDGMGMDDGEVFVRHSIAPGHIEALVDGRWIAVGRLDAAQVARDPAPLRRAAA